MSLQDSDKTTVLEIAKSFRRLGFELLSTRGTADYLSGNGICCRTVSKVSRGRPHVVDAIKNSQVQLIVNTATGSGPLRDGFAIRRAALQYRIPYTTTIAGADAVCRAIDKLKQGCLPVFPLQDYHLQKLPVLPGIKA